MLDTGNTWMWCTVHRLFSRVHGNVGVVTYDIRALL